MNTKNKHCLIAQIHNVHEFDTQFYHISSVPPRFNVIASPRLRAFTPLHHCITVLCFVTISDNESVSSPRPLQSRRQPEHRPSS